MRSAIKKLSHVADVQSLNIWLTAEELSDYLKIKLKTVYYLVHYKKIPHYRIGKLMRFKQDEIDQWMETKRAGSFEKSVDKIVRSIYTPKKGRPDRLTKEVNNAL